MPDHLLQLAPDAKSLEAGRRLFYSRRWRLLGGDGEWLWGEFDVNANRPVQSAIQLTRGSFHCSCRARARPCAHNLALILIFKHDADRYTVGQPPEWVRSTQFQTEKKQSRAPTAPSPPGRQEARRALMTAGVDELELRLLDIARRGLSDTQGQGSNVWLDTAARLTDTKLPGLAGRFRRLATLGPEGTETEVARALGDVYLFIRAWRKREELPPDRQRELDVIAGLSPKRAELLNEPPYPDHWLVMGTVEGQEDRLRYQRVWLRAEKRRRYALLLDFAFGEMPFEQSWPLAAAFDGPVHYYPGSYAQRAVFPEPRAGGRPYDGLAGYTTVAALLANYRRALGVQPWLLQYPVLLEGCRPLRVKGAMQLVDTDGSALPLVPDYQEKYRLLAVSGGHPVSVFGEFDGYLFRPLSLLTELGLVPAS
jgi:hypothetical protein